jgi:hypothetical protein
VSVVAESDARLERLQPEARTAFAVLCAQRLMDAHLRLPKSEQRPFTLSWAPVFQVIWAGLEAADSSSAKTIIGEHLKAFYEGGFNHNLGQDGPSDPDDDAAACSIYAAQVFCRGDVKSARWAAGRMIDASDTTLQADTSAPSSMQVEADRLLTALQMLESQPWTPTLIPALRAAFR